MTINQIYVFIENKPGKLAEFTDILSKNNIDMRAMSIAETPDFGVLRIIVNDSYNAACVIREAGYVFSITPVLAVAIPDEPGSLGQILKIMGKGEVNLEYLYAFTAPKKDWAYMVFRVQDNEKAIEVLSKNGVKLLDQAELDRLFA